MMDRHQQWQVALAWRENGGQASLQGFDLSRQEMVEIDLAGADLSRANLAEANLRKAQLRQSEAGRS